MPVSVRQSHSVHVFTCLPWKEDREDKNEDMLDRSDVVVAAIVE